MFLHRMWCRLAGQERRGEQPKGSGRRWRGRWLPGRRLLDVLRRWP